MDIARLQHNKGAGIFACDDQAVVSFKSLVLSGGLGVRDVRTVVVDWVAVGTSKDGTAGNALQFIQAWEVIRAAAMRADRDWIVKADPDAVLFPDRLRSHLEPFKGDKVYMKNCDKPMTEGPAMFGSLEAISRLAMVDYFVSNGRCKSDLQWKTWGEDLYMMRCLEHVGVRAVGDFQMVQDGVCKGVWCGAADAAAFHPMKSVAAWQDCWAQAEAAGGER